MSSPCSDVHLFVEVASVTIPVTKKDIVSFAPCLDNLLIVAKLHHAVSKNTTVAALPHLPSFLFDLVQGKVKALPLKRILSLDSLLPLSKRQA